MLDNVSLTRQRSANFWTILNTYVSLGMLQFISFRIRRRYLPKRRWNLASRCADCTKLWGL